jgi:hypothetical protein
MTPSASASMGPAPKSTCAASAGANASGIVAATGLAPAIATIIRYTDE